jgi:hypothetical protein
MEPAKMTDLAEPESVIERWMLSITANGGIERYDDLHIDQIDELWRDRRYWLQGGLQAYALATHIRDKHRIEASVSLTFSLKSDSKPRGVTFASPLDFQAELDWSPPSLYLFCTGKEPWTEAELNSDRKSLRGGPILIPLDPAMFLGTPVNASASYYLEFLPDASAEYSRSVFLAG